MARLWSATALVGLTLLGCLLGTGVEAQQPFLVKPNPEYGRHPTSQGGPQVSPPRPNIQYPGVAPVYGRDPRPPNVSPPVTTLPGTKKQTPTIQHARDQYPGGTPDYGRDPRPPNVSPPVTTLPGTKKQTPTIQVGRDQYPGGATVYGQPPNVSPPVTTLPGTKKQTPTIQVGRDQYPGVAPVYGQPPNVSPPVTTLPGTKKQTPTIQVGRDQYPGGATVYGQPPNVSPPVTTVPGTKKQTSTIQVGRDQYPGVAPVYGQPPNVSPPVTTLPGTKKQTSTIQVGRDQYPGVAPVYGQPPNVSPPVTTVPGTKKQTSTIQVGRDQYPGVAPVYGQPPNVSPPVTTLPGTKKQTSTIQVGRDQYPGVAPVYGQPPNVSPPVTTVPGTKKQTPTIQVGRDQYPGVAPVYGQPPNVSPPVTTVPGTKKQTPTIQIGRDQYPGVAPVYGQPPNVSPPVTTVPGTKKQTPTIQIGRDQYPGVAPVYGQPPNVSPPVTTVPGTKKQTPTIQIGRDQYPGVAPVYGQPPNVSPPVTTVPGTKKQTPTIQAGRDQYPGGATVYGQPPNVSPPVTTLLKGSQQKVVKPIQHPSKKYPGVGPSYGRDPIITKKSVIQAKNKYPMLRPRGYAQQKSSQDPQILQPGVKIPSIQQPTGIKHPSFQSCDVPVAHRVPCGGRGITAAECDAISCCFDGQQCFFGKAVTVQCTKDAQFIVVVARDATLPHLDLETISLMGTGDRCSHVDSNAGFAIYQFPVTACGTVVMEEPGVIIYENRMASSFEVDSGLYGVVTRDSYYELLFQCRYTGTSVETLVVEVLPIDNPPPGAAAMGPIRVHLRLANGQCASKGCNELDVVYTSFFTDADYPVTKVLRDPVYVEVQLLEKADPNLVLVLDRCWATMAEHPHSLPQWDILVNGCPYRDDRYLSQLVPIDQSSGLNFPSHYKRFLFKMFTFVEDSSLTPLHEHVYIHCSTAVCSSAVQNCEHSCFRKQRDVEAVMEMADEPKVVATVGPVMMSKPEDPVD